MNRWKRVLALGVVGLVVASLAVVGAAGWSSARAAAVAPARQALPVQTQASAAGAALRLTRAITAARSLPAAVAATREALAWGGVATADGGRVYVKARGPRAALRASRLEALNLAVEARGRKSADRLTLAQYGAMLHDFGFPFRKGVAPGKQLVGLLRDLTAQAKTSPDDPQSFTPLFLVAMAKRQQSPVDVARGTYPAAQLRLTLLETELFGAMFMRVMLDGRLPASVRPVRLPAANTPCGDFKESFNQSSPLGGEVLGAEVSFIAGKAIEQAVERMTGSKLKADAAGKMLSAANIGTKLQKLAALYGSATIRVFTQENDTVHKPRLRQNVKSTLLRHFSAIAGLDDVDWKEYQQQEKSLGEAVAAFQQAMVDCLRFTGLPTLTGLGDLAGELPKWRIHWRLETSPNSARLNIAESMFDAGLWTHQLKPLNDHEGGAALAIDVQPERDSDHPGKLEHTYVIAHAFLNTSQPPTLQTFIDATQGPLGLTSSIVELSAGWLQSLVGPRASAELDITYHVPQCRNTSAISTSRDTSSSSKGSADDPCKDAPKPPPAPPRTVKFPLSFTGVITGHSERDVSQGHEINDWRVTITLRRTEVNQYQARYSGKGTMTAELVGSCCGGCDYSAAGGVPADATLRISSSQTSPTDLVYSFQGGSLGQLPYTAKCKYPGEASPTIQFGVGWQPPEQPYLGPKITGQYQQNHGYGDGRGPVHWDLAG